MHDELDELADLLRYSESPDHESEDACQRVLRRVLELQQSNLRTTRHGQQDATGSGISVRCPHCHQRLTLLADASLDQIACSHCDHAFSLVDAASPDALQPGQTIGRFELVEQAGSGSFGSVWRARDMELDRIVAIKFPHRSRFRHGESESFLHEARAAAHLNHPNIVSVHEVGRDEGTIFIVSDFVEGGTLDDFRDRRSLSSREVAELCRTLAEALHHAHENEVVHRDLKPSNIGMDLQGNPYVMDFGLAVRSTTDVTISLDGRIMGTPSYMSPEQARGDAQSADRRSDIYALGVIMFELLTGERPFRGNVQMLLEQVINADPPGLRSLNSHVPRDLETICLKCLEKSPDRRYATANDLQLELGRFLAGAPILARPITRLERAWRWCCRNPLPASLATLFLASLVAGTTISTWKWREANANAWTAEVNAQEALSSAHAMQQQSAALLFDCGQTLCETGRGNEGLHYLLEALATSPRIGSTTQWRTMVATNLHLWRDRIPRLKWQSELPNQVSTLAISHDDSVLAVGTSGGMLYQMRAETGETLSQTVPKEEFDVSLFATNSVQFSPANDSLYVATGASTGDVSRGVIRKVASPSGEVLEVVSEIPGTICSLNLNDDGTELALAGGSSVDGGLGRAWMRFLDLRTPHTHGKRIELGNYLGNVELLWRTDDAIFATKPTGGGLQRIDLTSDEVIQVRWPGEINLIAGHPDRRRFAVASSNSTQLGNVENFSPTVTIGHGSKVSSIEFHPDGTHYLVGTESVPQIVDVRADGGQPPSADSPILPLAMGAFSRRGEAVFSATNHRLTCWELPASYGSRQHLTVRGEASSFPNHCIISSPDGSRVCWAGPGLVRLLDATNSLPVGAPLLHPLSNIRACCFSPDGKLIATACDTPASIECYVRIWHVKDGSPVTPWLPQPNWVSAMAFSPDGRTLATGDYASVITLWDVATQLPVGEAMANNEIILSLAYSRNGKQIIVGLANSRTGQAGARIWNVELRTAIDTFMDHQDWVSFVAFSPDSTRALTVSSDGFAKVWDDATGELVGKPIPYSPRLGRAVFSPDGTRILTGSSDGVVRLWTANGEPVEGAVLRWRDDRITSLAIAPDQTTFLVGLASGRCQLCDTTTFQRLGPPWVLRSAIEHVRYVASPQDADNPSLDALMASQGGSVRQIALTQQVDPPTELAQWRDQIRAETGITYEPGSNSTLPIEYQTWKSLTTRIAPSPDATARDTIRSSQWRNRLADAMEDGETHAQRFYLDRMIPASGGDWRLLACRADGSVHRGELQLATDDYIQATSAADSPLEILNWQRQQAALARINHHWKVAEWYLSKVIESIADDWTLYRDRAEVLKFLGNDEARERDIRQALDLSPDTAFMVRVADEYALNGAWQEAWDIYERAHKDRIESIAAAEHHIAAGLMTNRHHTGPIITKLFDLVERSPLTLGSARASVALAGLAPTTDADAGRSLELAHKVVSYYPESQPLLKGSELRNLAMLQMRLGQCTEAIETCRQSVRLMESETPIHWMIYAFSYAKLGNLEKATAFSDMLPREELLADEPDPWYKVIYQQLWRELDSLIAATPEPVGPGDIPVQRP